MEYTNYYKKQVMGGEIATLINKAIDKNKENNVETDENGNYINNENNSINIDIKRIDVDKTYSMETIYDSGMDKFVQFYGEITFKCTKLEYHNLTNRVKYMLFEQITQ